MGFKLNLAGRVHEVTILARRPHLVLSVDGRRHVVDGGEACGDGRGQLTIDGSAVDFVRAETADGVVLKLAGRTLDLRRVDAASVGGGSGSAAHVVRAPMPGLVIAIHKQAGDRVSRGETVLTIESMKLQMKLDAPRDGEIGEIGVREGEGFDKDAILARLVLPAAEG